MSTTLTRPRPLCQGPPPEWWETGDDGNRLALMLCRVCPARDGADCNAGLPDPRPHGVIRAGVPHSEAGNALRICDCGYPAAGQGLDGVRDGTCLRCAPPPLARWRNDITRWVEQGDSYTAIGRRIGAERTSVRDACRRWGIDRNTTSSRKAA